MSERKKYYMDMVVGDHVYLNEEKQVVQRYFFGLLKRLVPKQSLYRITEILGIDENGELTEDLSLVPPRVYELRLGLVNVDTNSVRNLAVIGYWEITKKRKTEE